MYNVLVNFGEDWPPFKGLAFLFSDLGASFIGTALEGKERKNNHALRVHLHRRDQGSPAQH